MHVGLRNGLPSLPGRVFHGPRPDATKLTNKLFQRTSSQKKKSYFNGLGAVGCSKVLARSCFPKSKKKRKVARSWPAKKVHRSNTDTTKAANSHPCTQSRRAFKNIFARTAKALENTRMGLGSSYRRRCVTN